jgi:hypothetical protein
MMKFKIEVEIDDEEKSIKIRDDRKPLETKEFNGGIYVVAADGEFKTYYVLSYGSSADIGWAMAQAINDGWKLPFVRRMFFHFSEWINKFITKIGGGYDVDGKELEEVADRLEKEDEKKFH